METPPLPDKELVVHLKKGSINAFNLLFARYERRLYAFAYSIFPSQEDVEEVVQEVFYKVWKNRHLLDEKMSFRSFIFTMSRNYLYNQLSKRVSETAYKHYYAKVTSNQVYDTEEVCNFDELKTTIQEIVNKMPEKRKQVFTMSRFEGLTNPEIAKQLNLSLSTVENHINLALKTLRQKLYLHDTYLFLLFMFLWG